MKVRQHGSNATEIENGDRVVLFSYETPVAVLVKGKAWFRTEKKWSVTTSRHINKWLDGVVAMVVPQAEIERLANGGKP